jgi:hypothetical protein
MRTSRRRMRALLPAGLLLAVMMHLPKGANLVEAGDRPYRTPPHGQPTCAASDEATCHPIAARRPRRGSPAGIRDRVHTE